MKKEKIKKDKKEDIDQIEITEYLKEEVREVEEELKLKEENGESRIQEEQVIKEKSDDYEIESEDIEKYSEEFKEIVESNFTLDEKSMDKMVESFQTLSNQIGTMNQLFNERILHTEHEDKIVDNMHAELQKYKEDLYAKLVKPILMDIIEVRDSMIRMVEIYQIRPEEKENILTKELEKYAKNDLQEILEKNEVEIYQSEVDEAFVPVKQRIVKKVVTDKEEKHGLIAEIMSSGYSYLGRVISPEKVAIYNYQNKNK